ncbi:MAG: ABC transporter ATP-binding protein [Clostridiales bacterium]|nr:ABC transporter ATP-binding protein [Clostridiales bacterium]
MANIKRFISYYKKHLKLFTLDMVCAFIMAGCDLFYPMVTRSIINVYIPNRELWLIVAWCVALLLIYILKAVLSYIVQYFGHIVGVRMQADMRRDVFARLQKLPFTFFDENKTGSIMSRVINGLHEITELAHHGPEDLFISFIMLIGSFIILANINLYLTIIIFVMLPFAVFFTFKLRIKLSNAFRETREEVSNINAALENSISGIRVAKAFTNDSYENERFEERNISYVGARARAYKVMAEFHSGNTLILDSMHVVVLVAGGLFCYHGHINFGDLAAYLLYINSFLSPIRRLIGFIEQYQNGMSGFNRFADLMDTAAEEDSPGARDLDNVEGEIEFKNVTFSYDKDSSVLKDISVHVEPGKTVALVGPSGGGKTTFCRLLPRFYDVDDGDIYIDGKNIKDITLRSLRENIGIVQQEVFLFTGSIYENIAYGRPDATKEEVYEAAKRAKIHDFILTLEDGYNSYVGEHGVKLSGGQKQRVAIARVFLKNPPIVILDEATSSLDNITETMIQRSLEELSSGRTTIVVAHRLSTVRRADEILVMTDEGIIERGNHEELLARDGEYAVLYNAQFKD